MYYYSKFTNINYFVKCFFVIISDESKYQVYIKQSGNRINFNSNDCILLRRREHLHLLMGYTSFLNKAKNHHIDTHLELWFVFVLLFPTPGVSLV